MQLINPENLKVKRGTHGLGLFTAVDIQKDTYIIEYTGELITHEEANRRGGQYLFTLNETHTIDGSTRQNKARYINHSCRPNCDTELSANEKHIYVQARRNIKAGEELTYNYGKEFWNTYIKSKGCRCVKCLSTR